MLVLESDYKYTPAMNNCEYDSLDHTDVFVANWTEILENNVPELEAAVV